MSPAELVRFALRMSPDRVIVGETRGEEVLALLNAMSQGTDGSMATLHASSSKGAFSKLATYAVQAPERLPLEATNLLVANAVHFVIHLAQDGDRRFISSVREVVDAEGQMVVSNEVFRPGPDGRAFPEFRYVVTPSTSSPRSASTPACWIGPRAGGSSDRAGRPLRNDRRPRLGDHRGGPSWRRAASPRQVRRAPAGRTGHAPDRTGGRRRRAGRGGHALACGRPVGRPGRVGRAGAAHRRNRRGEAVGRIEAVAGWSEMLRDTMAGAAGLEQAIVATATVAPLPIRAEVATLAVRLETTPRSGTTRLCRRGGRPDLRSRRRGFGARRRAPGPAPWRAVGLTCPSRA